MLQSSVIQELNTSSWSNIILAHNCKCELLVWKNGKILSSNNTCVLYSSFEETWRILCTWDFDSLIKKLISKYYRTLSFINTTNINFHLLHVWLPFERRESSCHPSIYYIDWNIFYQLTISIHFMNDSLKLDFVMF